jgi:NAD(P)H-hydrate epimerase
LLKGPGTLIAGPSSGLALVQAGNPGMASGGMGDVLSGIIGALLAQGLAPFDAARFGALVHAMAADRAVLHQGERGLLATDLMPHVRRLLNGITNGIDG